MHDLHRTTLPNFADDVTGYHATLFLGISNDVTSMGGDQPFVDAVSIQIAGNIFQKTRFFHIAGQER